MEIKVIDNGEPLVDIKALIPEIKLNIEKSRLRYEKSAFLRKTVAEMLQKAHKSLPPGYSFIINDAWRPVKIQKMYFDQSVERFKLRNPDWSESKIISEVKKICSTLQRQKSFRTSNWSFS